MDPSLKKRKADENSNGVELASKLTPEDARKIIEPFSVEQLLDILQDATVRHLDVLDAVRFIADRDPAQRKLFIRGLGWETTTEGLHSLFSSYGELEEAVVILDKASGKSKGYGFITFRHIDGALLAIKEPSKKIDGRMTVTQLAASGISAAPANEVSHRKIYVANVPQDMPSDRLLMHFLSYGEIEEGPLGFDKQTGKSKGFALFVYKTVEGAKASLVDPVKNIDGHQLFCKLAIDGKKGKPSGGAVGAAGGIQDPSLGPGNVAGDAAGLPPPSSMPGSLSGQYSGPGGISSFGGLGGFSGSGIHAPVLSHHLNTPSSIGGPGHPSMGSQIPSSLGAGVPSSLGTGAGPGASAYGNSYLGANPYGSLQFGGPGPTGYNGTSSLSRLPPSSVGMPSGGGSFPEGRYFGMSSGYHSQHHPQAGSSPVPRVPSGGMYQSMPHYY